MLDWPLLSAAGLSGKPPEDQRAEEREATVTEGPALPTPHPLCLLFLSPDSYAPVSFSPTQALPVNICLISLFKSPFSLLVSHPRFIHPLPQLSQHPIAEVQPELPCFQMTQQHRVYLRERRSHRLFHMPLCSEPSQPYTTGQIYIVCLRTTASAAPEQIV